MKNYSTLICFLIGILFCKSQIKEDVKLDGENNKSTLLVDELSKTNSGNWKDVFTDFAQLAFKDLAGDKKSFQFKTTLFALKVKADSAHFTDYNYAKASFTRNFQVEVGLNLDSDYKFTGFKYGVDWAVINKRDLSINTLVNKEVQKLYEEYLDEFSKNIIKYREQLIKNNDRNVDQKIIALQDIIEENSDSYTIPLSKFPEEFTKLFPIKYSQKVKVLNRGLEDEIAKIKRQPLLTIGFNSNFQKDSKFFDEYNVNMVYLQGIKSKNNSLEIDFRNKFRAKDSIITSVLKRKEFSSQLGLNISLMKVKDKSIIEFKPSFEYTKVFSGLAENEKDNIFTANADLRIRILNNLWLPLILKYDMENNNLFGFLNVSFNFDAIKDE